MYDEQITKTAKGTSPSQTVVAKPTSSDTVVGKGTSPSQTIVAKPATPAISVTAKGTSPTQTTTEKPNYLYLLAEDFGILTAEDGTEFQIEE